MEETLTPAAKIRKHAPWLMIISGVLMAFTIGSMGPSNCIGADNGAIDLPKWNDEITQKEQTDYQLQNWYKTSYYSQFPEQYRQQFIQRFAANLQNDLVLLKDAQRSKINVTNKEVIDEIQNAREFQNKKGQFDLTKYYEIIGRYYSSKRTDQERAQLYEDKTRNEITLKKLKSSIIKDVSVTEAEVKTVFHDKFDTLDYEYVRFDVDFKNSKSPTVEDTKKLYEKRKNTREYMSERQAKINYAFFPYVKYEASVKVSDAEIKKFYDDNKKKYIIKEEKKKEDKPSDKKKKSKKDENKKEVVAAIIKYTPLKEVSAAIKKELTIKKSKEAAAVAVSKIHTKLSEITVTNKNKDEVVILKTSFDQVKPEFGEYGLSEYFSAKQGGIELTGKMGDTGTLRQVAFSKLDKKSIARLAMPKGELLYQLTTENVKESASLTFEQVQNKLITELKQTNGWDEAKTKCETFIKICESEGWKKTTASKSLTPIPASTDISKAKGKHKTIVDEIIAKKTEQGKFTYIKRDQLDNVYFAIMYKSRKSGDDKQFKKESLDIKINLNDDKIAAKWQEYSDGIQEKAGIKVTKE